MITPGDAMAWIVQNLWIVSIILWGLVLLGVGGTIFAFIKWVGRGVKQMFNPWYILIITALVIASAVVFEMIKNTVFGWL